MADTSQAAAWPKQTQLKRPLFPLGKVVATPGALSLFEALNTSKHHGHGDLLRFSHKRCVVCLLLRHTVTRECRPTVRNPRITASHFVG